MAELKHWYLVCYDLRHPERWRRAYKLLQGHGERLQYSIFRCLLSLRQREKLRWQLEQILEPEDDLLLTGLCHRCVERIPQYNRPSVWVDDQCGFRVI